MGLFDFGKNKELEDIITMLHANMSNNYKDNAQDNLRELEKRFEELKSSGKLSERKQSYYEKEIGRLKDSMRGFTHKDQKPYWTKD